MAEPEENDEIAPETGEAARLRGKIKQLMVEFAQLPEAKRIGLLSEREALGSYITELSKTHVSTSTIKRIQTDVETTVAPMFREARGELPEQASNTEDASSPPKEMNTEIKMKAQKLRSNVKADLQKIANIDDPGIQETIGAEKDALIMLNRKLCKDDITSKELQQLEMEYAGFQPYVEAATRKAGKSAKKKDYEDDDDEDDDHPQADPRDVDGTKATSSHPSSPIRAAPPAPRGPPTGI